MLAVNRWLQQALLTPAHIHMMAGILSQRAGFVVKRYYALAA